MKSNHLSWCQIGKFKVIGTLNNCNTLSFVLGHMVIFRGMALKGILYAVQEKDKECVLPY